MGKVLRGAGPTGNMGAGAAAAYHGLAYAKIPVCHMDGRKITAEAEMMGCDRGYEIALIAVQVAMASIAAHIPGERSIYIGASGM